MKQFYGHSSQIFSSTLCKVDKQLINMDGVFVYECTKTGNGGQIIKLVSKEIDVGPLEGAFFRFGSMGYSPNIGDIVLIEPKGLLTVLYEALSNDNAILVTEECNSRCLTCPQPPQKDKGDTIGFSKKLIELMSPQTQVLGLTGGEPTVKWDGLLEIIRTARENIPEAFLQLLTNGRIFSKCDKAEEIIKQGDGKVVFCIPIYSDIDAIHDYHMGRDGAFWQTLEGIHNLNRFGAAIEIRTVLTKKNFLRINSFANFLYRTFPFVSHIAFMGYEVIGYAQDNFSELWVPPHEYADNLNYACKYLIRRGMNVSIYNHPLCLIPDEIRPLARQSISDWKINYLPTCSSCLSMTQCGGMFMSSKPYLSEYISPVK